jgi:branched-chain amino acid aminotransferase
VANSHFAEGCFESLRSFNGRFPLIDEHLQRLQNSLAWFGAALTSEQTYKLTNEIYKIDTADGDIRVRVKVSLPASYRGYIRESQGLSIGLSHNPISDDRFNQYSYKVQHHESFLRSIVTIPAIKTLQAGDLIHAQTSARENGFDDALMVNQNNLILEAASANLFWLKNGIVFTPPLAAGCLPGVMRETIIAIIKKEKLQCEESLTDITTLLEADAVFLTNSIRGIIGVEAINTSPVFGDTHKIVGHLRFKLQDKLFARNA